MDWKLLEYDSLLRIAIIDVDNCAMLTYCSIDENIDENSPEWMSYLEMCAQSVIKNMDPSSPTYDPSLTKGE